jgi:hypothetical protein
VTVEHSIWHLACLHDTGFLLLLMSVLLVNSLFCYQMLNMLQVSSTSSSARTADVL